MSHAINYRLTKDLANQLACEVHVNGQCAVILRKVEGKYSIIAEPKFHDPSVSAEDLQAAIEGGATKLENAL